jgi:hypothetical protein
MKKIFLIAVSLVCILVLASCGTGTQSEEKVMETANTVYNMDGNSGNVALDEESVRTLLSAFSQKSLGLSKPLEDYTIKLSAATLFEKDACRAELYFEDGDTPEGVYVILGTECYVYNTENNGYFLLTKDGTVKVTQPNKADSQEATTAENVVDSNDKRLHQMFKGYTAEQLGLDKEVAEYKLVVTGATATSLEGETVYVISIYEQEGFLVEKNLGFNEDSVFRYSESDGAYVKLTK